MNSRRPSLDQLIENNAGKLKACYQELRAVMPEYFFRTYSENEICAMLPFLSLLQPDGAALETEIGSRIFRFYLREKNSKISRLSERSFTGAVIHESDRPFTPAGASQMLVVESFTVTPLPKAKAQFPLEEIRTYFEKNGPVPEGLDELFPRLNWAQLVDLTIDRLADRIEMTLEIQGLSQAAVRTVSLGGNSFRMFVASPASPGVGGSYFGRIVEAFQLCSFHIERAYWREFSRAAGAETLDRCAVDFGSFYFDGDPAELPEFERAIKALYYTRTDDLFHREFQVRRHWNPADVNLFRAGAEFLHSQFAFIDSGTYDYGEIERMIVLHPELAKKLLDLFRSRFDPDWENGAVNAGALEQEIAGINSGVARRDLFAHHIFEALLEFITGILKTNFFVIDKGALAFRLKPDFMSFYAKISPDYLKAFPPDRPCGIFFFYRWNSAGFHVRFSEIARGGWRTVIPRIGGHELERSDGFEAARDEYFREVYVLGHTQHSKNKDIFEGGSKLLTLLRSDGRADFKGILWEAQKALFCAFMSLVNCDETGALRDSRIIDLLGTREIIEIGPDENLFNPMICYMGDWGKKCGYTLGSGIISGKPGSGINHKEYGVTSFGLLEYFLRSLNELGIDPAKDWFSVKISGGPYGDVAGNFFKLLLRKTEDGSFLYPGLRITAVTDGPAAVWDPVGIDREELLKLDLKADLDKFDPKKLKGEGAYMIFSAPKSEGDSEYYRMAVVRDGKTAEERLSRDGFMRLFQTNLNRYADIFVPCGGRPWTVSRDNWRAFANSDGNGCRAIIEGANSFLTPDARMELQSAGILDVRDASANKCGVITSSYEIMCGLMLDDEEFLQVKDELVAEVMEILVRDARREAEWLFREHQQSGRFLTDLSDTLSRRINQKNVQISDYLDLHPELISDKIILAHLPGIFATRYPDRLSRLPQEYRKAIVAVELAARIVYNSADALDHEISGVISEL